MYIDDIDGQGTRPFALNHRKLEGDGEGTGIVPMSAEAPHRSSKVMSRLSPGTTKDKLYRPASTRVRNPLQPLGALTPARVPRQETLYERGA